MNRTIELYLFGNTISLIGKIAILIVFGDFLQLIYAYLYNSEEIYYHLNVLIIALGYIYLSARTMRFGNEWYNQWAVEAWVYISSTIRNKVPVATYYEYESTEFDDYGEKKRIYHL